MISLIQQRINEHVTLSIERYYDRAHQYNEEKIVFKKDNAQSFDDYSYMMNKRLYLKHIDGPQTVTNQIDGMFCKTVR